MKKTLEQKAAAAAANFDMTASEVKKVYAAAKRRNRGRLVEVTGWYCSGAGDLWRAVDFEICDAFTGARLADVVLHCCMYDRRQSFIESTIEESEKRDARRTK